MPDVTVTVTDKAGHRTSQTVTVQTAGSERRWSSYNPTGNVTITQDTLLDVSVATVSSLTVAAGATLRFDPTKNVQLKSAGNIVVHGTLHTELEDVPGVTHRITFTGANESAFVGGGMDPLSTDVGLWVMHEGMIDWCGYRKSGWHRATASLAVGSKTIVLDEVPTNWQVGDELIVCPSAYQDENFESVRIASVSGSTVTLVAGLVRAHPAVTLRDGSVLGTEILNLTRNAIIEGLPGKRAHVFVHSMMPQMICHTTFQNLGPQQSGAWGTHTVLGRYAVHFHHCMEGSEGSEVESCVVRDCGAHAYVPHTSHGIRFTDCVSYNTVTPAYWWDHPSNDPESYTSGTVWEHCLAALVEPDDNDFKYSNAGFVFPAGDENSNSCIDCAAVGVQGGDASGFFWDADAESVWVWENGVGHNNPLGIRTWQNDGLPHVVDGPIMYRNGTGIDNGAYGNSYQYKNGQVIDNGTAVHVQAVSAGPSGVVPNQEWSNMHIDAAGRGPCISFPDGRPVHPAGSTAVKNCTLKNAAGSFLWIYSAEGDGEGANSVVASGCTFSGTAPKTGKESGAAAAAKITVT